MKPAGIIWKAAWLFLIIAGFIGLLMRLQFFSSVTGFNYQYLLHTHSHVILLGWVFNALIAGIHIILLRNTESKKRTWLYILFQVSVLGMLITFPIQGYDTLSIIFSTSHIILSYLWIVGIWKKTVSLNPVTGSFLRWGFFYFIVSTIGPFSLGPIIVTGGAGSDLYFMAIYFYLHFLYNGAFLFILTGMFLWLLEKRGISYDSATLRQALRLLNAGCVLTLMLSALWMQPHYAVYLVGAIGGLVQIIGCVLFFRGIKPQLSSFRKTLSKGAILLFFICFISLIIKVLLQLISSIPAAADFAYEVRNVTIGYLHLVFLGIISPFLFAWFNSLGLFSLSGLRKKAGLGIFIAGFILTESIIVIQPWWKSLVYYQVLFGVSAFLWVGMLVLFPFRNNLNSDSSNLQATNPD